MFDLESKQPKILVIGDLMMDHYIWSKCNRISPEAPVAVAEVQEESNRLGGACNVAHNLAALGAKVEICGVIGNDQTGKEILKSLEKLNIGIQNIAQDSSRQTTKKSRVIVSNQQMLRIDRESKESISKKIQEELQDNLESSIKNCDCVVISDYDKGLLGKEFTQYIIKTAKSWHKLVLCDPKGNDYSKYKGATLLTPNKKEASSATGIEIKDDESLQKAGLKLLKDCDLSISIITLSEDGIGIFQHKKSGRIIPTLAKEVYDVTGAGDSVIAALAFGLGSGLDIYKASEFANIAAAVVVGKVGSAVASQSEISKYLQNHNATKQNTKILNLKELKVALKGLKESKIIFTNGCFDILHAGHTSYLFAAKELGDVLIVGLNSDASIKRLKGENRPINSQFDRALLLSALSCVDYIVIFDEDTPLELIKEIRPDVLVKGGDYHNKKIVGDKYAKEVKLIDFIEGKSTSNIIDKIQNMNK